MYVGKVGAGVPTLTVDNSTFDSNRVEGGKGGLTNVGFIVDADFDFLVHPHSGRLRSIGAKSLSPQFIRPKRALVRLFVPA